MIENNNSTKWKIFITAVRMFSDFGYEKTSMRDIAKEVGIKPASLYNHFESKDDILMHIYEFYGYNMQKIMPDMDKILKDAETEDIYSVLKQTDIHFDPDAQNLMDRIVVILGTERRTDKRSEELIQKHQYESVKNTFYQLLNKLIDLGRIEPIDIETFVFLYYNFAHGASLRGCSNNPVGLKEWESCLDMIYSLIIPKEVNGR